MAGNSFGDVYRITTFGESHGPCVGVIIDGCPSRLELNLEDIQKELDRRKPGQSKVTSQRKEPDKVIIDSGIFEGKTTGQPIGMRILNEAADSSKYENLRGKFRPGHADHTYHLKWGIRDHRGGGRASARETAARVMAGAVAKQILRKYAGTEIIGCTVNIGGIEAGKRDYDFIEQNILRCPDPDVYEAMLQKVESARQNNDSIGGAVEVIAKNVPAGLGEPVFYKLNAVLMQALGSIPAVRKVGFGRGSEVENMLGSEYNDQMRAENNRIIHLTNNAGGIVGGISNGEDIIARLSVKPTPTRTGIPLILATEDYRNETVVIEGKHDPVIMPRLVPVAEAMMAIVLTDYFLKQKAYEALRV